MRRLRNGKRGKPRKKTEPLAEGIIVPLENSGRKKWSSMSDRQLIDYAKQVLEKNRLKGTSVFQKTYPGLSKVLRKRNLMDFIGLERKKRKPREWGYRSDEELVNLAREVVREKGLTKRSELLKADHGLYNVLRERRLLGNVIPRSAHAKRRPDRFFSSMSDHEIIDFGQSFVIEKELGSRTELSKADNTLYKNLRERQLLGRIGFESQRRDWSSVSDKELVFYAKAIVEKEGWEKRVELQKGDRGLYFILRKRGLLDRIGFEMKRRPKRDWGSMSDDELVEYARGIVEERKFIKRNQLAKADSGLYGALRKRKLLDGVIPHTASDGNRDWASMSDEELVEEARRVISEEKIKNRGRLQNVNPGLYSALRRRGLLDSLAFEKKRRNWASMSDEQLVGYANRYLKESGISGRVELKKADEGLYDTLRKRKLLDRVFAPIESYRKKQAVQEVVDAMKDF